MVKHIIVVERAHTLWGDGETSHNIDVSDSDLLYEMTILGEDLHSRAFISSVTDDISSSTFHYRYFTWVPQLPFFLTCTQQNTLDECW